VINKGYHIGMPLLIDEAFLPATLTAAPMTDDEFAGFCARYPDFNVEMTAGGEIVIMPPNYSLTAVRNGEITAQLNIWASGDRRGAVTDSSGGFLLPNGARRSPDAAWTLKHRVQTLDRAILNRFWHLCPEFIIELRSQTDRLPVLRAKMQEWIDNGAQLGWLIDPECRTVEIYRPGRDPEVRSGIDRILGEGPVGGFELELSAIWDPLSF
jgi:Uma2 family endonuclease